MPRWVMLSEVLVGIYPEGELIQVVSFLGRGHLPYWEVLPVQVYLRFVRFGLDLSQWNRHIYGGSSRYCIPVEMHPFQQLNLLHGH